MLFNSLDFLIFFLVVTTAYFLLPHKFRWFLLLVASCYFYAAFVPIYILILFFTIVVDYFAGIYIEKSEGSNKKKILVISIITNVGILFFFKYYNFFIDNINNVSSFFGASVSLPVLSILLPIGLSFHTFQAMSYTIEVYRGNQAAEKHFGIYSLYVMFYPQLVAGPIERPQNMLHQFHEKHVFNSENLWIGLRLILWGLFKKVVIADRISIFVNRVFENSGEYNSIVLIIGAVFFAIQIYCDFSGYSDIAIGTAKTMGFELMTNFRTPFFSKNVTEYWRRWHISLSTWFNDYLFTSVAINKRHWGIWGVVFAIFITFSLSGLWHGAAWAFVVFGILNGLAVIYELLTKSARKKMAKKMPSSLYNGMSVFLTFSFACLTFIFFRASNIEDAFLYIKSFFTNIHIPLNLRIASNVGILGFGVFSYLIAIVTIMFVLLIEIKYADHLREKLPVKFDVALVSILAISVMFLGVFQKASFIYFQF